MTPLEEIIRRRIAQSGPMPVSEYMALCLGHPEHGYYMAQAPFGAAGDFTTAPEISQMFGELIGLALAQAWMDQGRPRCRLVELGPGSGRLMADARRALSAAPGFLAAAEIDMVETSPRLRAEQARALGESPHWRDGLGEVPAGPLFLIANEFFDALPIAQHVRAGGLWRERVVGLEGDALTFGLGRALPGGEAAPEGAWRESSPASAAIAAEIGRRIAAEGGAAILIDYGYAAAPAMGGDTLQAMAGHAYVDPLRAPGQADLTAHVDFASLAQAAEGAGAQATGPVGQGLWLARLGIGARAEALASAHPDRAESLAADLHRLTDPAEMGTLFKVLAIHPKDAPPPPGF